MEKVPAPAIHTTKLLSNQAGVSSLNSDYKTETNNGQITITKYIGPGGEVKIPGTINGLPVVAIGDNSFAGCSTVTGITIPEGATTLGGFAFAGCSHLTHVSIPGSLTGITQNTAFGQCPLITSLTVDRANPSLSISSDGVLFSKDRTTLIIYPNGKPESSYAIPDGVTAIQRGAFAWNHNLSRISIPKSVTNIGKFAFYSCSVLTKVIFNGNAPKIEDHAIQGVAGNFKVYYKAGAQGFTSPVWTDNSGHQWPSQMQ